MGGLAAGLPGRPTAAAVARPGRAPISPPSSRRPPAKLSARPDMSSQEMESDTVLAEEPAAKRPRTRAESGPPPSPLRTPPRPTPLSAKHRRDSHGSISSRSTPTPRTPGRKLGKVSLRVPHLNTRESLFSLTPPPTGAGEAATLDRRPRVPGARGGRVGDWSLGPLARSARGGASRSKIPGRVREGGVAGRGGGRPWV